jgi:crotonobetainyl-CoA:carnitine CoA-transferase CaiB-like acyl-CoA transferase
MADPQTVARGTMATVEDAAGPFLVPNPPFKFADGSVGAQSAVPQLGQDTRAVLTDILKMDAGQIDRLVERSVIDTPRASVPTSDWAARAR